MAEPWLIRFFACNREMQPFSFFFLLFVVGPAGGGGGWFDFGSGSGSKFNCAARVRAGFGLQFWAHADLYRVCVRARACVCVRARRALKLTSKGHFWVLVRPNDQIHIKHVKKKTAGLKSIHLNTVYVLKWTRTVGRKLCVNILS